MLVCIHFISILSYWDCAHKSYVTMFVVFFCINMYKYLQCKYNSYLCPWCWTDKSVYYRLYFKADYQGSESMLIVSVNSCLSAWHRLGFFYSNGRIAEVSHVVVLMQLEVWKQTQRSFSAETKLWHTLTSILKSAIRLK